MPVIRIASRLRDYPVNIADDTGFIAELGRIANHRCVVDENVWRLYKDSTLAPLDPKLVIVQPIDERLKTLESVAALYDRLAELPAKRNLTLVAIGGGILQDIAGFVASTLYRGIEWRYVPTTLLAQADSCIGGKTSLNYRGYKNLLGTFYPPGAVHVHPPFLQTLERPDFYSGLGEVVKLHIMGGPERVRALKELLPAVARRDTAALSRVVTASLEIKRGYITEDEFDRGRRNLLNFGHCFGHAIETTSDFRVPHGQAVLAGIILAGIVARNRGMLSAGFADELRAELLEPNLVVPPDRASLQPAAVIDAMARDKKRRGAGLALVVLKDGFELERLDDLTPAEAASALEEYAGRRQTGGPKSS